MDRHLNGESSNGHRLAILNLLAVLIFSITFDAAWATPSYKAVLVEVFTVTDREVVGQGAIRINEQIENVDLHVHELNGIQLVEAELSRDLTANPDQSRYIALQRIQVMDDQVRSRLQRSAIGLAMAMQYGVDRYPAIVFNGEAVVYGITDLHVAIARYQEWRAEDRP